jgi:hypothetical protein
MLSVSPVTTTRSVLRLRMEEMEGSGQYIEYTVADGRQGVKSHVNAVYGRLYRRTKR